MQNKKLNDFIIDILQDFYEIESLMKLLKDSTQNENTEITIKDIGNALEILTAKMSSTKKSFEKYIDTVF